MHICIYYFQLNMTELFLRTKFLKWVNHFAENSQKQEISPTKMFQKLVNQPLGFAVHVVDGDF